MPSRGPGCLSVGPHGQAEPLSISAAKVVALSLASLGSPSRTDQKPVWIGCQDGSLVAASAIQVQGEKVVLTLAAGGELATTLAGRSDSEATFWDEVTFLQPTSPLFAWLSDQKTLGYKHIPFLSVDWPYQNDRSVTGSRLRSGGAVFRKGLGMHTTSRLAYDVAGYRRFEAEIALDESAGRRGSVLFKVLLQDGEGSWTTAYESPIIRGGEAPTPVSVELKGATRLALIVEFADRGDELDHANWLAPAAENSRRAGGVSLPMARCPGCHCWLASSVWAMGVNPSGSRYDALHLANRRLAIRPSPLNTDQTARVAGSGADPGGSCCALAIHWALTIMSS